MHRTFRMVPLEQLCFRFSFYALTSRAALPYKLFLKAFDKINSSSYHSTKMIIISYSFLLFYLSSPITSSFSLLYARSMSVSMPTLTTQSWLAACLGGSEYPQRRAQIASWLTWRLKIIFFKR